MSDFKVVDLGTKKGGALNVFHARGDMYKKAVFCDFYKEVIQYAFKMIAEDNVKYLLRDDALEQMEYEYQY